VKGNHTICFTVGLPSQSTCAQCAALNYLYTPWAIKKGATFIFTITLVNVDRFQ